MPVKWYFKLFFHVERKGDEYILQQTKEQAQVAEVSSQQEKKTQGKVKQYGKYTVQSTFAGNCSITDIMNCYIERKASLKYQ